eukprot:scaffold9308_cov115-Cylindrotheca_fusiformis.AAC.14
MSTPVSVEPPPLAHLRTGSEQERDFQEKVKTMIALQYHEQHLAEGNLRAHSGIEPRSLNSLNVEPSDPPLQTLLPPPVEKVMTAPWPSERDHFPSKSSGVGMGTLFFSKDIQPSSGQSSATYGAIPEQQHEFHYGNPGGSIHQEGDHSSQEVSTKPLCEKICCLYRPFVNLLGQEQLRRSFCYGAIDGMLTGSGIASAFCALGVLNVSTKWEVRLAVVAFSAAACFADSLCMAIGHVWTSYVVSSGHATEREIERRLLVDSKSDAKAKLVEMLLARGVLKIDAMSLADTLEGYPDLFVNALVGDSLCAGPDEEEEEMVEDYDIAPPRTINSLRGGFGSWQFPSYGQFNETEHDPEQANVTMVVKESQREGFFMMIGFGSFAMIPSLLWLYLPLLVQPATEAEAEREAISPLSLIITITASIMWFLGVWKSSFLDSSGITFGIETVVVLLICIVSAYGIGLLLAYCLGDSLKFYTLSK